MDTKEEIMKGLSMSIADRLWLARRFFDITKVGVEQQTAIARKKEQDLQARCHREGENRSSYANVFIPDMYATAVISVNFAHGLEITLKALRFMHKGEDKKGHGLEKIYDTLPENVKEELEREFKDSRYENGRLVFLSFPYFKSLVETCDKLGLADGTMKYFYELLDKQFKGGNGFSLVTATSLYKLSNVMIRIMKNSTLFPPQGYSFMD